MRFEIIPLDDRVLFQECDCEFTPYVDDTEKSWHYLRRCPHCKETFYSLHCPHESPGRTCGKTECKAVRNQYQVETFLK